MIGTIIASGIFLVPHDIALEVGSVKTPMLVWLVGGVLSLAGVLTIVGNTLIRSPLESGIGLALVLADESPRHIAECREGRGFSPAVENGLSLGALAPEATRLQGLKAHLVGPLEAAGLQPRPSKVRRHDGDFRH